VQRARIVLYAAERLEGLEDQARSGRPPRFPPQEVAEVKVIACELPASHDLRSD
jgi:hypothetical protein